jgi:hypothetical protein
MLTDHRELTVVALFTGAVFYINFAEFYINFAE